MAFMVHRRLAIPLWAVAFFACALTVPVLATLSLIVVLGITLIAFSIPGLVRRWRASPSVVPIPSDRKPRARNAAIAVAVGACVRTLDMPNSSTAPDALDLVRMDDDGGWQMARPPA
jgi:hypothetical protein